MKIAMINAVTYGSTGGIVFTLAQKAKKNGHEVYTFSGVSKRDRKIKNHTTVSGYISKSIHIILSKFTGYVGCFSYFATVKLVRKLKKIKPDIIHLHNLHGYFLNIPIFFRYLKNSNAKIVWTLHDCWSFTGQCPHFTMAKCDKWKTGCYDCDQCGNYPRTYVDRTKKMWKLKKNCFTGVKNLTIVTPSQWLGNLVGESYMSGYPVRVINNGINLSVFGPKDSDFRKRYNIEDKFVLLGVAFGWDSKKGLDVFTELASRLNEEFQIVLVGTDDSIDSQLPENIISIHRTQNQEELAEIYTAADLFVNPTREENYPTVNMESIACGTPVLTFRTGGSPEIPDETCGSVTECDDIDALEREIVRIKTELPYSVRACLEKAKNFDADSRFEEYMTLYEQL